jgi:hypothetical protein
VIVVKSKGISPITAIPFWSILKDMLKVLRIGKW